MGLHRFSRCLSSADGFLLQTSSPPKRANGMSSDGFCGRTGKIHVQDPRHIETAWGAVVIVRRDGSVSVLHEKGLSAKLELLYAKSLFLVALNLAQSEEVSPAVCLHSVPNPKL